MRSHTETSEVRISVCKLLAHDSIQIDNLNFHLIKLKKHELNSKKTKLIIIIINTSGNIIEH